MAGKANPTEHPKIVYLLWLGVVSLVLVVLAGVVHHFAISPHGPELLAPVKAKLTASDAPLTIPETGLYTAAEQRQHFHNIVDLPQLPNEALPECVICHTQLPHNKNRKIRSLINMHAHYMVCETCHLEKTSILGFTYQWYHPLEDNLKGAFYGTRYDEHGTLIEGENPLAKIAPFLAHDGVPKITVRTAKANQARQWARVGKKISAEDKQTIDRVFHSGILSKGYECETCHTPNGLLNLKALGFSEQRITDLSLLNIKGMITKYEEFYLPNLFRGED